MTACALTTYATETGADELPPPYSAVDDKAPPTSQPAPAAPAPEAPGQASQPANRNTNRSNPASSSPHQPHFALETQICRYHSQTVKVTLKVALRHGSRDHMTVVTNKRHSAPTKCVNIPGSISARQAPYYFRELDHESMHQSAMLAAVDSLSQSFAPRKTKESMVLFYDKRIQLSKQALAAATAGDWDSAVSYYERGVEYAHNHNLDLKKRARVNYNLGVALAGKGDFDESLKHLELAEFADSSTDMYSEVRVRVSQYAERARLAREQRESIKQARSRASCTR